MRFLRGWSLGTKLAAWTVAIGLFIAMLGGVEMGYGHPDRGVILLMIGTTTALIAAHFGGQFHERDYFRKDK